MSVNKEDKKFNYIQLAIVIMSIVVSSVVAYYTGQAALREEISTEVLARTKLEGEVNTLKINVDFATKQSNNAIQQIKKTNEQLNKLTNLLSAKWGIPLD